MKTKRSRKFTASIVVSTALKAARSGESVLHALLILKHKSKNPKVVASGKWTLPGGKRKRRKRVAGILRERESSKGCARRENKQEVCFGVPEGDLIPIGRIIGYKSRESMIVEWNVAVYAKYHGSYPPEVKITEHKKIEKYRWFPINKIPWRRMMPSDQEWLPKAVQLEEFGTIEVFLDENK